MEAPEKLYLTTNGNNSFVFTQKRSDNKGIEYVRKDAFIKKAYEYFAPHIMDNSGGYDRAFVLEDFKKYMEG